MNEKDYVIIYLKSIFPVIIVLIVMAIYGYFTSDEPLFESFFPLHIFIFCYYMSYLLIGLPFLAFLHRAEYLSKTTLIIVGCLCGFIVMAFFDSFRFGIWKGWNLYLIFTSTGGLSGFYVHRLLNKKSE
jgi:hypothetical protein